MGAGTSLAGVSGDGAVGSAVTTSRKIQESCRRPSAPRMANKLRLGPCSSTWSSLSNRASMGEGGEGGGTAAVSSRGVGAALCWGEVTNE